MVIEFALGLIVALLFKIELSLQSINKLTKDSMKEAQDRHFNFNVKNRKW
jgi:hypothetical protein